MRPLPPTDADTLAGLRRRDSSAFALLYTFYYPAVERFVTRNSGNSAEAEDVFQETLLVLLDKVPRADFTLTSSLKTYLLAIAQHLWLKRLRTAGRTVRAELAALEQAAPAEASAAFAAEGRAEPQTLVQSLLARLTAKCQALVRALFFGGRSIAEVAQENGYTTLHNARNQKYKCLEQARRGVQIK